MKKALVAVSGGVDSSVAALETIEAGFNCIGATMKLFHPSTININPDKATGSDSDIEDAKAVCEKLGIRKSAFHDKANKGQFIIVKDGQSTLVDADDLDEKIRTGKVGKYVHFRRPRK